MDAEPASEHGHTDALLAGCSHSVHFLIGEAGSSASPWLLRHPDQRVVTLIVGLDIPANVRIPRGNKPLDPWLPVPAALHCFHQNVVVQTIDISGLTPRFRDLALPLDGDALHVGVEQDGEGLIGPT